MVTRTSGTVSKALDIIDIFVESTEELGVGQLSDQTGINKSTVVRLCATLESRGYLQRGSNLGRYRLGPRTVALARAYLKQFNLEDVVRPVLSALRDATNESASFYVPDKDARICLFRENSHERIRHHVDEGERLPFREGVVGRVLLAYSGEQGDEYDSIRDQGYLNAEGRNPFTASVAAPVLDRNHCLIGAIVVSGPSSRFNGEKRQQALKLVLQACTKLSGILSDSGINR
ncbi:IclR family transcriptional regulator [Marinobacterium aestuariivivens]|uniref:IclR family transcriptional regulator n=1 Tax=Marinobacterium aestuariivivens TaxID=1698799 RepID=A0ABW2AAP1_9GAMM